MPAAASTKPFNSRSLRKKSVNVSLGDTNLYFTHLFIESQVILTPDWLEKCLPISIPDFQHLRIFRPSTPDLILTRMMRIDAQDREDLLFLLRQPDAMRATEVLVKSAGRIYLTGGACALLHDWRPTTIDIDLKARSQA